MKRNIVIPAFPDKSLDSYPTVTVAGNIIGPDGNPIAGALLFAYLSEDTSSMKLCSGADGSFSIEVDPTPCKHNEPLVRIAVFSPGYALIMVDLDEGDNHVISLTPECRINGMVTDPAGTPLAGVTVILELQSGTNHFFIMPDEWSQRFTVQSADNGTWSLPGIVRDGEVKICIVDDRYVAEKCDVTTTNGEQNEIPRLIARPCATVTGLVVVPDGIPVGRAYMMLLPTCGDFGLSIDIAANGSYRMAGIPAGSYILAACSLSGAWVAELTGQLIVHEGVETVVPDIHAETGAVLNVNVVDANTGQPIPGVDVLCLPGKTVYDNFMQYGATTDIRGRASRHLKPGQIQLLVPDPPVGYINLTEAEAVPVMLEEGKINHVTLKLRKGLTLTGRTMDTQGTPAAGVPLNIHVPCGKCDGWCKNDTTFQVNTDAEGHFTANGLPAGKGTLSLVKLWDISWEMDKPLEIELPAKDPISVVVRRTQYCTVRGRVVDTAQRPLDGVTVTFSAKVYEGREPKLLAVTTRDDGYYQLDDIPAGVHVVLRSLEKTGYQQTPTNLSIKAGERTPDDLVMAACNTTVHGIVRTGDGTPVPNATIISVEGGMDTRATTDANGAFTLPQQPEGVLHLIAAAADGGGVATSTGNATDAVITFTPSLIAKPCDIPLALQLLDDDAKLPEEQRLFNRPDVIRAIADIDLAQAMALATADGVQLSDQLRAYLLGKLAETDPEKAAKVGTAELEMVADDHYRLYAAIQLGLAVHQRDPILSEHCYAIAKGIYDQATLEDYYLSCCIDQDYNNPMRILSLAGLLNKTDDVQAILAQVNEVSKRHEGQAYRIIRPTMAAAGRVNPEFVFAVYDGLNCSYKSVELRTALLSMASWNPEAAQRLQSMIAGRFENVGMGEEPFLLLVKELAKKDPAAVLRFIDAQSPRYSAEARLVIARFLPKEQASAILHDIFTVPHSVTIMNVARANAVDPEFAKSLYAKYRKKLEEESYTFTRMISPDGLPTSDRMVYARLISSLDPVEARLLIETEFARTSATTREGTENPNLQYFSPAMCALDIHRALALLDAPGQPHDKYYRNFLAKRMMNYILLDHADRITRMWI